jgi:hypothetical protein
MNENCLLPSWIFGFLFGETLRQNEKGYIVHGYLIFKTI